MNKNELYKRLRDLRENLPPHPEVDLFLNNASRALKFGDLEKCYYFLDEAAKIGRNV